MMTTPVELIEWIEEQRSLAIKGGMNPNALFLDEVDHSLLRLEFKNSLHKAALQAGWFPSMTWRGLKVFETKEQNSHIAQILNS